MKENLDFQENEIQILKNIKNLICKTENKEEEKLKMKIRNDSYNNKIA